MSLFRREVQVARAERTEGHVFVSVLTSWHLLGLLLATALVAAAAFLFTADYARVEAAPGVLMPDRDVVSVVAPRGGIVADLRVAEGTSSAKGKCS